MKTINIKRIILSFSIGLILAALLTYDLDDLTFEANIKQYILIFIGILLLGLNYIFFKTEMKN